MKTLLFVLCLTVAMACGSKKTSNTEAPSRPAPPTALVAHPVVDIENEDFSIITDFIKKNASIVHLDSGEIKYSLPLKDTKEGFALTAEESSGQAIREFYILKRTGMNLAIVCKINSDHLYYSIDEGAEKAHAAYNKILLLAKR